MNIASYIQQVASSRVIFKLPTIIQGCPNVLENASQKMLLSVLTSQDSLCTCICNVANYHVHKLRRELVLTNCLNSTQMQLTLCIAAAKRHDTESYQRLQRHSDTHCAIQPTVYDNRRDDVIHYLLPVSDYANK